MHIERFPLANLSFLYQEYLLRERLFLRIVPDKKSGLDDIRFSYDKKLAGIARVKNEDLNIYNFQLKYLSPLLTFK